MKNIILLLLSIILVGCQTNRMGDSRSSLHHQDPIDPKRNHNRSHTKSWYKKLMPEPVKTRLTKQLEGNLIVHSRYLFLEDLNLPKDYFEGKASLKDRYAVESSLLSPYAIDDKEMKLKYEQVLGREVVINNYDREQYTAKIIDVVLIEDRMIRTPYVAAVLEIPEDKNIYYAWTSEVGSIEYPFYSVESESIVEVRKRFENSSVYGYFEENYETHEINYSEVSIESYEHYEGKQYYVAQYQVIGYCESLIDNLVAVYQKKDGKLKLIGMNRIDYFILDIIDFNGDDFPELLGGDFSSSIIYSLENGEIEEVKSLSWSSNECPC
jgi:hypothetical protein